MKNEKNPQFKVGDVVVISKYGTVGMITNVTMIDGLILYEVNYSDQLYVQNAIQLLADYENNVEIEKMEIDYKFYFGDIVKVLEYGNTLFKVIGIRTEIWHYQAEVAVDIIYELVSINEGEWLEVSEEELVLLSDKDSSEVLTKKHVTLKYLKHQELDHFSPSYVEESDQSRTYIKKKYLQLIDYYLDIYNDYKRLYETFQDEEYKKIMDIIFYHLEKLSLYLSR
ncbi:hypothetical protein [Cytobacillus sp. IB215665]|uniref:hypothetical protein n=1 Tax=Cytobacillus sp. IB215665 TaxID=3097357 RepID=UPI002A0ACA22|nr:hypothetical protein [Cytobacillus sp. IB215665]MDX8366258.1 hypothetical protein [Cytobacillus sp. IB215665]